jgi:hypothetical protein
VIAGGFYLLLIDTTDLPELYAGAVTALLCAIAFEAGREQGFAEAAPSVRLLLRARRALVRVPGDVVRVSALALRQLLDPRSPRGTLRAVPFRHGPGEDRRETARRALAEGAGSLAPNTIVIGIDPERNLILAHQLGRGGGAETVDVLGLR